MSLLLILLFMAALAIGIVMVPALKGYRTLIYNVLVVKAAIFIEVLALFQGLDWSQYVPNNYVPWIAITFSLTNILLRALTTSPMGSK